MRGWKCLYNSKIKLANFHIRGQIYIYYMSGPFIKDVINFLRFLTPHRDQFIYGKKLCGLKSYVIKNWESIDIIDILPFYENSTSRWNEG